MPKNLHQVQLLFRAVAILFLVSVMPGCGPFITLYAILFKKCEASDPEKCKASKSDEFSEKLAQTFGIMALFAEVVYRRDYLIDTRNSHACEYLAAPTDDDYGMPSSNEGRWKRWRLRGSIDSSSDKVHPCFAQYGLYYETYVYEPTGEAPTKAVIAFRGTENDTFSQALADWINNFSATFGIEPRQYSAARDEVPKVINQLIKENEQIQIYAVGHSLGGGLAQQAGFLSARIKEVFTFNTSPVTNWTWLRLNGLVENEYPTIYRVFHGGEILEKIRFITTNLTSAAYGRYDIGVQYEARSNASGHSMTILACRFASIISNQNESDINKDPTFPPEYAKNEILAKGKMCDRGTDPSK